MVVKPRQKHCGDRVNHHSGNATVSRQALAARADA